MTGRAVGYLIELKSDQHINSYVLVKALTYFAFGVKTIEYVAEEPGGRIIASAYSVEALCANLRELANGENGVTFFTGDWHFFDYVDTFDAVTKDANPNTVAEDG